MLQQYLCSIELSNVLCAVDSMKRLNRRKAKGPQEKETVFTGVNRSGRLDGYRPQENRMRRRQAESQIGWSLSMISKTFSGKDWSVIQYKVPEAPVPVALHRWLIQ